MKAIIATALNAAITAAITAAVLSTPAVSFAEQSQAPITSADVRAELIQIEQAGYQPSAGENPNYPQDVQAAEARIAAAPAGVGGVAAMSQSGASVDRAPVGMGCTVPASFCNVYSGS